MRNLSAYLISVSLKQVSKHLNFNFCIFMNVCYGLVWFCINFCRSNSFCWSYIRDSPCDILSWWHTSCDLCRRSNFKGVGSHFWPGLYSEMEVWVWFLANHCSLRLIWIFLKLFQLCLLKKDWNVTETFCMLEVELRTHLVILCAGSAEAGLQCHPKQPGSVSWWLNTHSNTRQCSQLLGCSEVRDMSILIAAQIWA